MVKLTRILLLLLLLVGCNKPDAPDCFKTAGEEGTEVRMIEAFESIIIKNNIKIELVDSSDYGITVFGPVNLLSKIVTTTDNGTLYIEDNNTCDFMRSYKNKIRIRIAAPAFPDIQNFGTAGITSIGTIQCPYMRIENRHAAGVVSVSFECDSAAFLAHTGVADFVLQGSCYKLELFAQGLGYMDASRVNAQQVFANNSSINDVYVRAEQYLFAAIKFDGNIYYQGNPDLIQTNIEGSGQVIPD